MPEIRQEAGGSRWRIVSEQINLVAVGVTRPANTTAYAAGQAWGTAASCVFDFASILKTAAGKGLVVSARIAKTSDVLTNAAFRLWLFNTATLSAQPAADQAAINFAFTNRGALIGHFTFASMIDSGAFAAGYGVPSLEGGLPFRLATGLTGLTGFMEVTAAYTPTSSENMHVELGVRPEIS